MRRDCLTRKPAGGRGDLVPAGGNAQGLSARAFICRERAGGIGGLGTNAGGTRGGNGIFADAGLGVGCGWAGGTVGAVAMPGAAGVSPIFISGNFISPIVNAAKDPISSHDLSSMAETF